MPPRAALSCALAALQLMLLLLPLPALCKLPLPTYIKPCSMKLSRHEMNDCAKSHGNAAIPFIIKGDRRYRLPPLDPLHVERLHVDEGHGPLGLATTATDLTVHGITQAVITNVDFSVEEKKTVYEIFLPRVGILSKYNVSGRLLLLPITGNGESNVTLENVHLTYEYSFKLEKLKDGETYLTPKPHASLVFNTTRLYVHLTNLFNGDKVLGEAMNKFMDENWEELLVSMGPVFSPAISEIIYTFLSNIYKQVPVTDAFLDAERLKIP